MKITIVRKKKDGNGESIVNEEFKDFIGRIGKESREGYITRYRDMFPILEDKTKWGYYDRIPKVIPCAEYYKNAANQRVFRAYHGITMVVVRNLNNFIEIEKIKRQAAVFPQVLCAFVGGDGHSVVIFTIATLPDGTLPSTEELAELFCVQAYATSVKCLAPNLEYKISIEAPSLGAECLLTVDDAPYVNSHPTPFIIEQPTVGTIEKLMTQGDTSSYMERLKPSAESFVTFTRLFNAAVKRAQLSLPSWRRGHDPQIFITRIADVCADCGLPEEEVASRLVFRFYKENEDEVRSAVNTVYAEYKGMGTRISMSKHQIIALRLREFLQRRYEIRFNEMLQMTEYRTRNSLAFLFKELGRRELNSIHHEACVEGIEPTFGEVDQLVHSTFTPLYNPIEEYLGDLPQWDGKDYIAELANMVPNKNPHWQDLFARWFLSLVAHWMNCDTTHANQTAPILIGAQGYRKSTFCRLILPPELQDYFTDSIDFRTNVEAERCLSRFLLVNIDEFDQLSEKQFAFVKHLFQKPVTNIRRMYSETIGVQRRYASFMGTSNHNEILRDPTGNRRYLCVEVTAPIHTEQPINYLQLYAQAKYLITHGERYWLDDKDEELIKTYNKQFEVESVHEQLFLSLFCKPGPEDEGEWIRPNEIMTELQKLPTFNKNRDNDLRKLGSTLTKLKIEKKRDTKGYKYKVVRR